MTQMYFLIRNSDGDTYVETLTEDQVRERLDEASLDFLSADESFDTDTNYWGDHSLLIKGEVVVPQPKTITVTQGWEL